MDIKKTSVSVVTGRRGSTLAISRGRFVVRRITANTRSFLFSLQPVDLVYKVSAFLIKIISVHIQKFEES